MVPYVRSPKFSRAVKKKLEFIALELGSALYCWIDIGSPALKTHIWASDSTHSAAAEKETESHT